MQKDLDEEKTKKHEPSGKFELSSLASIISNIVLVKSSNQQVEYMQKLVKLFIVNSIAFIKANNLTEVIADRELALENQKKINKELIKRLTEFEEREKAQKNENTNINN